MTTDVRFIDLAAQQRRLGSGIAGAIARVLDHGRYIMGPEVFELEERLASYCGVKHAVTCSSGTDALLMALMARRVGPGDAVFVPTFTFAATAEVVALLGATPVFVDVDASTFNLDPISLRDVVAATIREARLRPACVVAVDLFGHPADYDSITEVATAADMWVLADAAQSFGATYRGRKTGALGDITATSFFPAKPLGCYGDGGAVFTDEDATAELLRSIRVHGQGRDKYENVRVGINGRLDTIQAAVLLQKLTILDDELAARDAVANRYAEALDDAVVVPRVAQGATSAWAQYTLRIENRDEVMDRLRSEGIPTAVYYPRPLHRQSAYSTTGCPSGLAVADELARTVVSLPMHPYLDATGQQAVSAALRRAVLDRPLER